MSEWHFPNAKAIRRGAKTLIMGIVNMTPDSFSGMNAAAAADRAVALAETMLADGADIIDIGAESSRPGAQPLDAREEIARLGDAVARLRRITDRPLSVDTYHAATATYVLDQGADIVNDITALRGGWATTDSTRRETAAAVRDAGAHIVLMHMPCPPTEMTGEVTYENGVVDAVAGFLGERVDFALEQDIRPDRVWLDPGFGFGKNFQQNRELLLRLGETRIGDFPILAGLSRKRMVGEALGLGPDERLEGSLTLALVAAMQGADAVRVHDVKETARAIRMLDALRPL